MTIKFSEARVAPLRGFSSINATGGNPLPPCSPLPFSLSDDILVNILRLRHLAKVEIPRARGRGGDWREGQWHGLNTGVYVQKQTGNIFHGVHIRYSTGRCRVIEYVAFIRGRGWCIARFSSRRIATGGRGKREGVVGGRGREREREERER